MAMRHRHRPERRQSTPPPAVQPTQTTSESQAQMIARVVSEVTASAVTQRFADASTGATLPGMLQGYGATGGAMAGYGSVPPDAPGKQLMPKQIPEMEQVSPLSPPLLNYGATGTSFFGAIIQSDEYNPEFGWRDAILKYEEMRRNDGQVKAIERMLTLPLLSAKWSIEPASDAPIDVEIASLVESCLFHDMEYTSDGGVTVCQTWSETLRHILLMLTFGFMPFEKCFRKEDGWIKWSRWLPLLPRTVWRWWVGHDNELEGIQQWAYRDYNYRFVNIPRGKFTLFTFGQEGQNYEGVSVFRPAFKNWWYKQNFEKIAAIGIERNGIEAPVFTVGPNASAGDVKAALTMAANLRANEQMGVVIPHDWKFEFPRMSQNHAAAILPMIQYHDVLMARAALVQFINLGSTETGAYALDKSQVNTFLMALQSVANQICDTVNGDPIPQLVDYNYENVAVYPKLKCAKLTAQDLAMLADVLPALTTYLPPGAELNDFFADLLGVPHTPMNAITTTNPTSPSDPARPPMQPDNHQTQPGSTTDGTNANGGGGAQDGNAASGDYDGSDGTADQVGSGRSDGQGGGLSEARLLREALDAAYGLDAVERGLQWRMQRRREAVTTP